jgi:hypothetical protein
MQDTHKSPQSELTSPLQPPSAKTDAQGLIRLLEEWSKGDEPEQKATFAALRQHLDEDRPDGYKLFP